MSKSNPVHADKKEDEIWIGNINVWDWPRPYWSTLKTVRLGKQAYDIHGKPIPTDYCLPIFIHKSEHEAYDKIMVDRINKIREGRL